MKIRVTSQFQVEGSDDLESRVDALFHELLNVEAEEHDISHADVSMVIAERLVDVSVVVSTDSWETAEARAQRVILEAIQRSESGEPRVGVDRAASLNEHVRSTELVPA